MHGSCQVKVRRSREKDYTGCRQSFPQVLGFPSMYTTPGMEQTKHTSSCGNTSTLACPQNNALTNKLLPPLLPYIIRAKLLQEQEQEQAAV